LSDSISDGIGYIRSTNCTVAVAGNYTQEITRQITREIRRIKMKKFLLGTVGLVALAAPAFAADLPVRTYTKAPVMSPIYDWSGFYLGINAGGASARDCLTINSVAGAAVVPNSEGCHNATGAVIGGQAGYRWQMTNWVFGLEAQGDWADLSGSNASRTAIIPYTNQSKIDALGLFTGQIGYAFNNVLVYAKGGAAVSDNQYNSFFTGTGVQFNTANQTRWGGTVGAGIEVGFAPNWSVGVEYNHLFMGNPNITFPQSNIAVTRSDNIRQDIDMGTVRLNYRFGGPVVAKY
jgi:outer membrane immunogenic protein